MPSFHPADCECPECVIEGGEECAVCHRMLVHGRLLPLEQVHRCLICNETLCSRCIQSCKTCGCQICPSCAKQESRHCLVCGRHLSSHVYIQWDSDLYCSSCDPYWQLTWQKERVNTIDRQVQRRLARKSQFGEWLLRQTEKQGEIQDDERCAECHGVLLDFGESDVCTTHYEVMLFHKRCLVICSNCGVPICLKCDQGSSYSGQKICANCGRFEFSYQRYKKQRESRRD